MSASYGICVVFAAMGACVAASGPRDDKDGTAEPMFLSAGETRTTPQQTDPFEDIRVGEDPKASAVTTDCVYVQWCNEPGDNGTICRLRSGCTYNTATSDECVRDTYAVCGAPVLPWYIF